MKFDEILEHVGVYGAYQKFLVYLLFLPSLFVAMHGLSFVFLSQIPPHRCYVDSCDNGTTKYSEPFLNLTTPYNSDTHQYSLCKVFGASKNSSSMELYEDDRDRISCPKYTVDYNVIDSCERWKFDHSLFTETVVTHWNLVCDRSAMVALGQSVYMFGVMIGAIVFGIIADRYGRKITLIIVITISSIVSTATSFVPSYLLYLFFKMIAGACFQGIYQTIFVMSVELVGTSKRLYCGVLVIIYFSFGEIILGFLAYLIRDWRTLQLTISLPILTFISYYWIVPESPRWLISCNRIDEAIQILEKIANGNNRIIPKNIIKEIEACPENESAQHCSMLDLFRSKKMRNRTLNITFNWLMITIGYYGISMSTPNLGGNVFWSFIIVSAIEIPSYFFSILLVDRVGRRLPLCFCLVVGGVAGTCTIFVPAKPEYLWLFILLALIGKFGAAAAFSIIYVFTAELFPTVIRNNGLGLSSMVGHIGGVVSPFIASLNVYGVAIPMVIYGVCSLLAGMTALILPETLNQELPDTIADVEARKK